MVLCYVEVTHGGQEGGLNTRVCLNALTHGRVKLPTLTVDTGVTCNQLMRRVEDSRKDWSSKYFFVGESMPLAATRNGQSHLIMIVFF